jgi:hypothetical protein
MPELELLPEKTKKVELKTKRNLGPSIFFLIIVLVLYGGLFLFNRSLKTKIGELEAQFATVSRDKSQEKRIEEAALKLNQSRLLLDQHLLWSKGLKKIQSLTLPSVQFQSLAASLAESRLEFRAVAPTLAAVAKQAANFLADESIQDLSLNQIKFLTNGQTEFTIRLTFDRNKFLK